MTRFHALLALLHALPRTFRNALLTYRSAMLGGVGEQSLNLFLFLSLSLLSLSVFPLRRYRVPLIRASRNLDGEGRQDNALRSSHSRIMQFSDVLMRRRRSHRTYRIVSYARFRSCRTLMFPPVSCLLLPETKRTIVPSFTNGGVIGCRDGSEDGAPVKRK